MALAQESVSHASQIHQIEQAMLSGAALPSEPTQYYPLADIAAAVHQRGETDKAIRMYQRLLEAYPTWPRPSLDLALIYVQQQRYAEARYLIEAQLKTDLPDEVKTAMIRLLRQIKEKQGWFYDVNLNISPDNNINNATFNKSVEVFGIPFELDPSSGPKSDIVMSAGGKVGYQFPIDNRQKIIAQFDAETIWYREYEEYNSQSFAAQVTYQNTISPNANASVTVRQSRGFAKGERTTTTDRVSASYFQQFARGCWARVTPTYESAEYHQNPLYDYDARSLDFQFSPCFEPAYLSFGVKQHVAAAPAYSYHERKFGFGTEILKADALTWRADATAAFRHYDQRSFGQLEKREDINYQLTTEVGFPQIRLWKFFYPAVQLKYARNDSNYDYFQTKKLQGYLDLKREF